MAAELKSAAIVLSAVFIALAGQAARASNDEPRKPLRGQDAVAAPAARAQTGHGKLVSLAPSNTELLCSLGASDQVEGVCSFCDFPEAMNKRPRVGTFVSANLERLTSLKPDCVLLVSGQEMLAAQLQHNHFRTLQLDNTHLRSVAANLLALGRLTGKDRAAADVAGDFNQALSELEKMIGADRARSKNPTVFYCVWPQPLMTAGRDCFLNEVLTACGGTNIAGQIAAAYPRYSPEQLLLKNPDIIIMPHEAEGQSFLGRAPWANLKAVKEKKIYFLPDQKHDMLSRPTLRVIKGAAWLTTILHPELAEKLEAWKHSKAYLNCAEKGGF